MIINASFWLEKETLSGETFTNCALDMDFQPDGEFKFLSRYEPSKFSFADPTLVQTSTQQYI